MAVERANPLPKGVYWVDVIGERRPEFHAWLSRHSASIHVIRTESHDATLIPSAPARDWFLFQVKEPVSWEGPGFPTIATEDTKPSDTVDRPPPEKSGGEKLEDAILEGTKKGITHVIIGGLLVGIGYSVLVRLGKRNG